VILISFLKKLRRLVRIALYIIRRKRPWTRGYFEYKWFKIKDAIKNPNLTSLFVNSDPLPKGYGVGLDERIVEYPWVLSRLPSGNLLLDAGSALNFETILKHPALTAKQITIVNIAKETNNFSNLGVQYVIADICALPFGDESFDIITCISTLEHIGMDNSIYSNKKGESTGDYVTAITELKRVLKPNGLLLVSVPFGKYENHGFFQQFNSEMIERIKEAFSGQKSEIDFYRYSIDGWQISNQIECENMSYFNIRKSKLIPVDKAAAARSVACLKLVK